MNALIAILVRLIEVLFVFGILGSVVVILMSAVEDFECIFEEEEHVGQLE